MTTLQRTSKQKDSSGRAALEVSKAIEQMDFVAESYGHRMWKTQKEKAALKADLSTMLAFGDLKQVRLQLFDQDKHIVFEMRIDFATSRSNVEVVDSAEGIELPLLQKGRVAGHRLVVDRGNDELAYRSRLSMNWKTAPRLKRRNGTSFESEHARRITGGRLRGRFHVEESASRRLRIYQTGDRGYAFGETTDGEPLTGVFCHQKFADENVDFTTGSEVIAVVIQTPRGLQGRNIRRA